MWERFGIVLIHLATFSIVYSDRDFCSRFTLIPRSKWSTVASTCKGMTVPVDMKWCDIAYSFLVGGDGNVYEGPGWSNKGTHTEGYNSKSFAVSFMGKFENHNPGEHVLKAAQNLIACGVQTGKIKCDYQLKGHRDVSKTGKLCPNKMIYALMQKWPRFYTRINDTVSAISVKKDLSNIVEVKESFCDFEKDFCKWRQDIGSQFNWVRRKGFSDCAGKTGPTDDRHGTFAGFYILADASKNERKQTKLRSPNIPVRLGHRPICVTFYYMMFGKDMGTRQLRMVLNARNSSTPKIIWERTGSQKDEWIKMNIQLKDDLPVGTIHFEFTANIGNGYLSDITLDDINIKQGTC